MIMKTKQIDDVCWTVLLIVMIIIIALCMSCSTSRQMEKEKSLVKTDCTAVEKTTTRFDITSDIRTMVSATTETTETIDTVVSVPDPKTGLFFKIPVKLKKTIKRSEFKSVQESKKDQSVQNTEKKSELNKSVLDHNKKVVTRRPNAVLYIIIAAAILLILLFVFLWKRLPLTSLFSIFKRKSP